MGLDILYLLFSVCVAIGVYGLIATALYDVAMRKGSEEALLLQYPRTMLLIIIFICLIAERYFDLLGEIVSPFYKLIN